MSSVFGNKLKISVFGQSHSPEIGVVIDGFPAGFAIDSDALAAFMALRAPGSDSLSTSRKEADSVTFTSGVVNGVTCGAPICATIKNTDARPGDYPEKLDVPRSSHADYTNHVKFGGFEDLRGGGHSSGRLTAPICVAGALCLQWLASKGVTPHAHIESIHGIHDVSEGLADFTADTSFPVIDKAVAERMKSAILSAKESGDSVGGTIEVAFTGLPAGIGSPMFDGLENRISSAVFAVPAIKGIEFGNGFASAELLGSENNDAFCFDSAGNIITKTNNHGGILGGITSGMPLVFRVAVKPTPSIAKEQSGISLLNNCATSLEIKGRHDPCIVPRAVPAVVSAAAIAIADAMLSD